MRQDTRLGARVWLAVLISIGCAAPPDAPLDLDEMVHVTDVEETFDPDDGKLDDGGDVRVRGDGLTVWIDPEVIARDEEPGHARFVIAGRASRAIIAVSASMPDEGELGRARIMGPRRFEIVLGLAEMASVTSGRPLWITLEAARAPHARYVVRAHARARIGAGSGERAIGLASPITPVLVDDDLRYRSVVMLGEGIQDVRVVAPIDGEVPLVDAGDGSSRFDVSADAIARAAIAIDERIVIEGRRRAGTVRRWTSTAISLSELAITHLDPEEAWGVEACADATRACLEARGGIVGDTSSCGDAWAVLRCRDELDLAHVDLAPRFVEDLRAHLAAWYAVSGEDARLAGGATLEAAQAAVVRERVLEIDDAEADPWAHDLATTRVLSHPDVVFPDSDRWWMGAYDRATGRLLDVYSFE